MKMWRLLIKIKSDTEGVKLLNELIFKNNLIIIIIYVYVHGFPHKLIIPFYLIQRKFVLIKHLIKK